LEVEVEVEVRAADGLERTELVTGPAADKVRSEASLIPLEQARTDLLDTVTGAPIVPRRASERAAAAPILGAFMAGLGDQAQEVLSVYGDRAAARLIQLVTNEHRRFVPKPKYENVVEIKTFSGVRLSKPNPSKDRTGKFTRSMPYEGFKRSLYARIGSTPRPSATRRTFSTTPMRSLTGSAFSAVTYRSSGKAPAASTTRFIAVDTNDTHWVIEVKSDKDLSSAEVQTKREQARRWANYVNADNQVDVTWRYLLVGETDIATAKGSWPALRSIGA
jgi:type III restriction enzyme